MPELYEIKGGKLSLKLHSGQTRVWESKARFTFMLAGTQSGKALCQDTPIPTPDGFIPMGDLQVGDTVLDERSMPCRVTFATPIMLGRPCYEVVFDDGATIVADAEHLWQVKNSSQRSGVVTGSSVLTTLAIKERVKEGYSVDNCEPLFRRYIVAVKPIESVPVRCIQVDSPSHLYLAGKDYIVTHNTSFGPWWLWEEILKNGGGDYLAVTSTYDLFNLKMLPEMLRIYCRILGRGKFYAGAGIIEISDPSGKFHAKRATDDMWARIIMRSASAEGGLESSTAKAAWLDEVGQDGFPLEAWEAVLRRLSLHQGRVLGTTTLYNTGWLKQQIYDKWVKGDKDYNVIQYASTVNPAFPKAEYLRAKRSMPEWKFKMFYRGEFDRPPGMIYGDYSEDVHMIDPIHLPGHWPRYVGIDPGGVNLATIWVAENPTTNVLYVYRETLEGDKTTKEHVDVALERAKDENVITWVGGAPSEDQTRRDWGASGIAMQQPTISEVWPGIDRVISLFKTKRVRIFSTLSGLRDEIGRYTRLLDPSGEPTVNIKDKNTYHRLDALRYVATTIQDVIKIEDIMPADMGAGQNIWGSIGGGANGGSIFGPQ